MSAAPEPSTIATGLLVLARRRGMIPPTSSPSVRPLPEPPTEKVVRMLAPRLARQIRATSPHRRATCGTEKGWIMGCRCRPCIRARRLAESKRRKSVRRTLDRGGAA